jgi:hypothetical protein
MAWNVTIQDPYPKRTTNERITAHDDVVLPSRLYDDSHQNVFKRVQPRSGFSIMTASIRDKSFTESYENGISSLSHVEQYTYDLHKKRSSGVTIWEYDTGVSEPTDDVATATKKEAPPGPPEEMPSSEVLNEHAKQAFASLEAQSIEPTFEYLYTELKKKKLSENVIAYILDNMMMHNMMRSLKEQSIAVTEETMKVEMGKKEISDVILARVLRRFVAWKQNAK